MSDPVEPLILDLLEWIGGRPRPCAEVLEAWRTSCPRLPVWEEANRRGFIEHFHEQGQPAMVRVSALGRAHRDTRTSTAAGSGILSAPPGIAASPSVATGRRERAVLK
jgi:hypothetical protein